MEQDASPGAVLKGSGNINKKRFAQLTEALSQAGLDADVVRTVQTQLCQVCKFDPALPAVSPERSRKNMAYKHKKAQEMGVSVYKATKADRYYQEHKQQLNARVTRYRKHKDSSRNSCIGNDPVLKDNTASMLLVSCNLFTQTMIRLAPSMYVARGGRDINEFSKLYTVEEAVKLLGGSPGHSYCEYFSFAREPDQSIMKLFFDMDKSMPDDMEGCASTDDFRTKYDRIVRERMDAILTEVQKVNPEAYYKVASRHGVKNGRYRLSYRPFVSGAAIRYDIIPIFIRFVQQDDGFWDMSVYNATERMLASINGAKEDRLLRMEDPDGDITDYLAQHVDMAWWLAEPDTLIAWDQDNKKGAVEGAGRAGRSTGQASFWSRARPEDRRLAATLALDPCLRKYFRVAKANLEFATITHCEETNTTSLYMKTNRNRHTCSVINRPHKHNNGAVLVSFNTGQLKYLCHDEDCKSALGYRPVDITACIDTKTQDLIQEMLSDALLPVGGSESGSGMEVKGQLSDDIRVWMKLIKQRFPAQFGHLDENDFRLVDIPGVPTTERQLGFQWGDSDKGGGQWVLKENTSVIDPCGTLIGMLLPDQLVKGPLTAVHKDIPGAADCTFNQLSRRLAVLKCITPGIDMEICVDMSEEDESLVALTLRRKGQKDIVLTSSKNKTELKTLRQMIALSSRAHVEKHMGPAYTNVFNAVLQQTNIVVNTQGGSVTIGDVSSLAASQVDAKDEQIAEWVVAHHPGLLGRMFYVSDNSKGAYYYCKPQTNIWSRLTNTAMENIVIDALRGDFRIPPELKGHMLGYNGRKTTLYCIGAKRDDSETRYISRLDENLDVFALDNGVFDCTHPSGKPHFRPTSPDDYVSTTTGWAYSKADAETYRRELDDFLTQVFPLPGIRKTFLTYVAGLLSGERNLKKFVVLTDRRDGNNGKSAVCKLMETFFGKLKTSDGKKVLSQASFGKGRDSHDAGLESLKGKRLIVAEEFGSEMTLDTDFLKQITGGAMVQLEGRAFNSVSKFMFTVQAGVIMTYNENRAPKAAMEDKAFVSRMLLIPMLSKFVPETHLQTTKEGSGANDMVVAADTDPFTYPIKPGIEKRMKLWMSSLADVLCEHFDGAIVDIQPPEEGQSWKNDLVCDANPLTNFLDKYTDVTSNRHDIVEARDLRKIYDEKRCSMARECQQHFKISAFEAYARSYFSTKTGASYHTDTEEKKVRYKKAFRGVQYVDRDSQAEDHTGRDASLDI